MTYPEFIDTERSVSESDLNDLEQRFNIKLPPEVRKHYIKYNGGTPQPNLFPKGDELFPVNEFLPIKYGEGLFEDTYNMVVLDNGFFPKHLVPIAVDAGGDFYCYSKRLEDFGFIYCYSHEYYDEPERAIEYLAKNLDEFLQSLIFDED